MLQTPSHPLRKTIAYVGENPDKLTNVKLYIHDQMIRNWLLWEEDDAEVFAFEVFHWRCF